MRGHTSIWFFSGLLLLSYGILITATGLWELGHPPVHRPELYGLHAPIWWGGLMLLMGLFYTFRFRHHR